MKIEVWTSPALENMRTAIKEALERALKRSCDVPDKFLLGVFMAEPEANFATILDFAKSITQRQKFGLLIIIADKAEEEEQFNNIYKDLIFLRQFYPTQVIKSPFELETLQNSINELTKSINEIASLPCLEQILCWFKRFNQAFGFNGDEEDGVYRRLNEAIDRLSRRAFLEEEHRVQNELIPSRELFRLYLDHDFAQICVHYKHIQKLGKINLIIIDDRLETFGNILHILTEIFPFLHCYQPSNWEEFLGAVYSGEQTSNWPKLIPLKRQQGASKEPDEDDITIDKVDVILLDLYFEGKLWTGQEILERLNEKLPQTPVFILTKSQDIDNIREMFNLKADGYIPKNRLIALPYYIYRFYREDAGWFLRLMKEKQRRQFLGYLRLWRRQQDLLWMNTKTPHMVDHAYQHANNLWKLLNQLTEALGEERLQENLVKTANNDVPFVLAASIWLHDIGHKGHDEEVRAHAVRREHALISGKHIVTHSEIYIPNVDKPTLENIARVCSYHPKKAAFSEQVLERLRSLGEESSYKYPKIFERFPFLGGKNGLPDHLDHLYECIALLRVLDSMDNQSNRVGQIETEKARVHNCYFEALYYLKEMERLIRWMEERLGGLRYEKEKGQLISDLWEFHRHLKDWITSNFFCQVVKLIERYTDDDYREYDARVSRLEEERESLKKRLESLFSPDFYEDWDYVSDHIIYLLVQPRHYIKHKTFREVRIQPSLGQDNNCRLIYTFATFEEPQNNDQIKRKFYQAFNVYLNILEEYYYVQDHLRWLGLNEIVFEEVIDEISGKREEKFRFPIKGSPKIFVALNLDFVIKSVTDDKKRNILKALQEQINEKICQCSCKQKFDEILSCEGWSLRKTCSGLWEVVWSQSPQWAYVWNIESRAPYPQVLEELGLQGIKPLLTCANSRIYTNTKNNKMCVKITNIADIFKQANIETEEIYAEISGTMWIKIPIVDGGKKRLENLIRIMGSSGKL